MGCSDSKIANVEASNRSKERKAFMKQSISAHNTVAKSHFMYVAVLKNMGLAFSDYAKDEFHLTPPRQHNYDKSRRIENLVTQKKAVGNEGQNVKMLEVFKSIDGGFLKASESANEVLKILETNKLDRHSNLTDNRGHVDHSIRVMRVISWNYESLKGHKIANDVKDDFALEDKESLATILDEILAWENKLYDQVTAGKLKKHEYEKKIALLNKLTKRGASNDSLERTQATVSHLHTRYIVEMQAIDSITSEIIRIRNELLYPKLVQLVKEMHEMWENMRKQHENQSKIAQLLTSVKICQMRNETSDHGLKNTQQLHFQVRIWCLEFEKLIKHQTEFIRSLNNWLKLSQISKANNLKLQNRKIESLLHSWQDELEKLRESEAKAVINNFADVIEIIVHKKSNEMKQKQICEKIKRDLAKLSREFEKWCDKQILKRIPSDEMDLDVIDVMEVIARKNRGVSALEQQLTAEEEVYRQWCREVDEAMVCLYGGLPEVFTAMTEFACNCMNMYESLK